ncbi:VF530 family protein [uncultured Formosa sp.]|uniref:VF530 family protein n=1 Tax=uncultured Formosa sp. TaxID=255435 RepID=UPI00263971C9|nr:VF530 family protein [uncultured Formosa sp.]
MSSQPNNPLHGVKLEQILVDLEAHYGWEYMGFNINIRCFTQDPSIKSSLKFLRRTPWARTKVEQMYLKMISKKD